MGEWSNLTQREKSNIIRFAIKNGVSDINQIRDTFNIYISGNGVENEYKEGGSIRIKHPGRLTALKKRTGKTEAELWSTGNAHTRKMITFARNARKWKHDDGGSLSGFSEYELERINEERRYIENQKQWLQNWYAKRLPAIGKEHLQEYVDAGLGVPYKTILESPTPPSPSIGANYHFYNDDYRNPSTIKEKGYDTGTGIYFYTYRPIGMLGFKQEKYSTPVHEFTHATQYGGSSIFNPEFTGGKIIGEFDDYLQRPDEQHARIMELRYENKLDPTKTDYTAEDIKNLKDPSGALQELRSGGMDDDAIINALNTWASNTESAFDLGNGKHISSTGGPLYPFSFQKNPYWKTPVVRYDSGGILGHQYGIGDFLSKLFAPTYSGDFSTAFASARNDGNSYFKWNGDRYSTQWETEKYKEEHPEEYVPEFAYTDAMNRIVREENVKLVKNGYIPELNAWQPHKSVEGGAKTIGYGLKLGPHNQAVLDELERNKSDKYPNGYISDAFALQQSANLLRDEYEPLAKKYWNSTFKDDSWNNLSPKMKSIILDYQYNVRRGIKAFPKLMRAIHDKDYDGIKANYKRYDDKKRELGRNKGIYQDLERLFGGYYSVYNN